MSVAAVQQKDPVEWTAVSRSVHQQEGDAVPMLRQNQAFTPSGVGPKPPGAAQNDQVCMVVEGSRGRGLGTNSRRGWETQHKLSRWTVAKEKIIILLAEDR